MKLVSSFEVVGILCFIHLMCYSLGIKMPNEPVKTFVKRDVSLISKTKKINKRSFGHDCKIVHDFETKLDSSANKHVFQSDSNQQMTIVWSGSNGAILALTTMKYIFMIQPSRLYRSVNRGKSFQDISQVIQDDVIRSEHGIQANPTDTSHVILVSSNWQSWSTQSTHIYITTNSGANFTKILTPFLIGQETFKFNPLSTHGVLMLSSSNVLFYSHDAGVSWMRVFGSVFEVTWDPVDPNMFFFTSDATHSASDSSMMKQLFRYDVRSKLGTLLAQHVHSFAVQKNFLLLTVQFYGKKGSRVLHVSKNEGRTCDAAQLPIIEKEGFYTFLDMSEEMAFVHVDSPDGEWYGSIYTSDERGIVYSLSLEKHLCPQKNKLTDFYKVKSLPGVYITTQIGPDNFGRSVITFDKGGTWHSITPPEESVCPSTSKDCQLHLHNAFSLYKGVAFSSLPLSSNSTVGLILAHGNLGDGLSSHPPDVYVSNDGGYTWIQPPQLKGPHFYEIGDSGGILFAISSEHKEIDTLMFSVDEGQCWHSYNFIDKKILVTGMSTEPGKHGTDISIWGWDVNGDASWLVVTFEFKDVLGSLCDSNDYTTWLAHEANTDSSAKNGCILGARRLFTRRRKGTVCVNGDQLITKQNPTPCLCVKEDYLCDYGYIRDAENNCVEDTKRGTTKHDICINDVDELISTKGYRKIPGDLCEEGFEPTRKVVNLHKNCAKAEEILDDYGIDKKLFKHPKTHSLSAGIVVFLVVGTLSILLALGYVLYKKRDSFQKFRSYTALPSDDIDPSHWYGSFKEADDSVLITTAPSTSNSSTYHDDSDEDLLVPSRL